MTSIETLSKYLLIINCFDLNIFHCQDATRKGLEPISSNLEHPLLVSLISGKQVTRSHPAATDLSSKNRSWQLIRYNVGNKCVSLILGDEDYKRMPCVPVDDT